MNLKHTQVKMSLGSTRKKETLVTRVLRIVLWPAYAVGLGIIAVITSALWLIQTICHSVGLAVLFPPKLMFKSVRYVWKSLMADVVNTIEALPVRLRRLREPQFMQGIAIFGCILLVGIGLLEAGNLLAEGLSLKGRVLGEANGALVKFEDGKNKIISENLEDAQNNFQLSVDRFRAGEAVVGQSNILIQGLINVLPVGRDAQSLLRTGEAGSLAAVHLTKLFQDLKTFTFNEHGLVSSSGKTITDVKANFNDVKKYISIAQAESEQIDESHIPEDRREQFVQLREQLASLSSSFGVMAQVFDVLEALTSGNKHVLLLLQNSNELRATGGFVGTFGAFDLSNGAIASQNISSIYDLDGQLKKKYIPPMPLFAVNDRWFLRDSNWFPSFPESAEVMMDFYTEETGKNPDVLIAITPALAVRMLALTGPITIPGYGVTVDADNFIEVTQVETSIHYDKKENKPKQMLADFFPLFLSRISGLSRDRMPELVAAFEETFAAKDIQMYARNQDMQKSIHELAWDGAVREASRDYINIVSTNLGGTKTDLSIEQSAKLASRIAADGSITNTLTITRNNPLPHVKGLENKTFLRVYVPKGSRLVSSKGFTYTNLDISAQPEGDMHAAVERWQKHAVTQVGSGMIVGEESGKTFFGNWISLSGGQRQTMELVYILPFRIDVLDRHSLLAQKQAGAAPYALLYQLDFPARDLLWATDETAVGYTISKELAMGRDRFYGVVLEAQK